MGMPLDDVPRELLAAIAAAASLYVFAIVARRWARKLRMRQRMSRAGEGEREAVALLEDHGFVVEAAQARATYSLDVDGAAVAVAVRADYLVAHRGERFVAEVKTGRFAPRLETSATRRQLMEYQHAFGVSGVLLVDADTRRVRLVKFHRPSPEARSFTLLWVIATLAAAAFAFSR
jgi:hypothetical protein